MTNKPIQLRARAAVDLEQASDHYRMHAGEQVALDFVDSVQAAFELLASGPGIGSLRYSYDVDIPGLGAWPIEPFDYAIFYVAKDDVVDVWRVLHTRRDIPETLQAPEL